MSRASWTEEDVEHLRKLACAGLSLSQIAREMKRTVTTVRVQALKWDIAVASDLRGLANHRRLVDLGLRVKK